ncbi:MAG: catalase family protein, partial [Devosia sp.]|uniref:catalase family protein n=1 Tax=Devosia sp. TaxID=1871048 RepID=UPI00339AD5C5
MANIPANPEPYRPDLEVVAEDEAKTQQELMETMLSISHKVYEDSGHAHRSVHSKSHGLLKVDVEVLDNLPEPLAQGVFAAPRRYEGVLRFSTIPGDILPDTVSTPRGAALKLLAVDGERLPGAEGDRDQDFVMVNGKKFAAPNAKAFLKNLKLLAATTDKIEGIKVALSGALRGIEKLVEKTGHESALVKSLGGEPETNILGESFFSQLALRHGRYIAKYALIPRSPNLTSLTKELVDIGHDDNAIRSAVQRFFETETGEWSLQAQLCADIDSMPIEDATAEWDEGVSPFVTIARVIAVPQNAWSDARSTAVDDGMGFAPWHGLTDHQPLGSIMRARRLSYDRAQRFRSEHNATAVRSP